MLLAIPNASRERRNQIIVSLRALKVHTRTLPSLSDLASGRVSVQDVRELDIDDLLGREPVKLQADVLASRIAGQTILVSGAGGGLLPPMPGKVISQLVSPGQAVRQGQALAVMEAMKMEHTISAPRDGVVAEWLHAVGDQVAEGAELLKMEIAA